jgi:hypothetical protein
MGRLGQREALLTAGERTHLMLDRLGLDPLRHIAQGEQRERRLADAVDAERPVDLVVDEADTHAAAAPDREQVCEHRPGVPVEVPVAALPVLPARAPVDPGERECLAKDTLAPQPTERRLAWIEVEEAVRA